MSRNSTPRSIFFLVGACAAFILSFPLWMPINGHDGWIHLNWLEQFTSLFRDGDLYPHWMPHSFSDFGSPAFYVYPPLTYWIASLLSLTGLHSGESLYYGMTLLIFVASGISFYFFARDTSFTSEASIIGALCYSLAPYVMIDVAIRNALGEHTAFIWLPLIFAGIERWIVRDEIGKRRVIGAALFIAGLSCLILTNIPVFIITVISSTVYVICCKSDKGVFRRLLYYTVGIVAVLSLTFFYTGTAKKVKSYLATWEIWQILGGMPVHRWMLGIGEEYQHFRDLFLLLSFTGSLLLFIVVWKKFCEHRMWRFLVIFFVVGILFQLPYLTDWIHHQYLIAYIQFDQRWNVMLVLATALSISLMFERGWRHGVLLSRGILAAAFCVPICVAVFFSNPPSREIVDKYHNDPPEYISKYVEHVSIKPPEYYTSTGMTQFIEGTDSLSWKELHPAVYEITKLGENKMTIRFRLQYFPFWWLSDPRMDCVKLYADSYGLLTAQLPKGKRTYYLSQVVQGSGAYGLLSAICFPLIMIVLLVSYYRGELLKLLRKINKFFNRGI